MASDSTNRRLALSHIRRRLATGKPDKATLERWADELGLEVEGTGAEGAVTKSDLLRAFEA